MKIKISLKESQDDQKKLVTRAFINARDTDDIKKLISDLNNAGFKDPLQAIHTINTDIVDSNFYQNACEQHNNMARELGRSEEIIKVDAFAHFPEINSDPTKSPDPYNMRNPKLKTMKENKMKITKEYLKQVIDEIIQEALTPSQQKSVKKKGMAHSKDKVKVKGRHLKTQIPRAGDEPDIVPDDEDEEKIKNEGNYDNMMHGLDKMGAIAYEVVDDSGRVKNMTFTDLSEVEKYLQHIENKGADLYNIVIKPKFKK